MSLYILNFPALLRSTTRIWDTHGRVTILANAELQ